MRDRRGIERGVVRRRLVDIGEIAQRHRHQIAVAQHHALGAACGARGVKQPGEIVGLAWQRCRRALAVAHPSIGLAVHRQRLHRRRQIAFCFRQSVDRIVRDECQLRAGIAADPRGLAPVQFCVDGDRQRRRSTRCRRGIRGTACNWSRTGRRDRRPRCRSRAPDPRRSKRRAARRWRNPRRDRSR